MLKAIILLMILVPMSVPAHASSDGMASALTCPCECSMVISTCDCPTAVQVKKEISSMEESGFSEKQVFSALQAEYGNDILAHPEGSDPIPLWIGGLALILVFLGYLATRKPDTSIVPNRERYEKRFEEEYRKFVSEYSEPRDDQLCKTDSSKREEK